MIPIDAEAVQAMLDALKDRDVYLHLESTTGAYAAHYDSSRHPSSAFVRNAVIRYERGVISGTGPYRVGLKMAHGWVYCEGLTHYEETETERLLLAGHNREGKLAVALQLSPTPF
ncbi:MAG: hypothetical protein A9Z00_09415 [Thermobacillus sp. ZCTH02-B1]|uniref:YojF family protein n=1 Tax=Thermobacillus sp. ZCTH02-B1 TaxID=1858795 RepID=UPI000B55AC4E|nr:YojF family protein [Thermobacillus sp. ZCTH02-B1]OUM97491.1 MAG: hypothetical protein A9Z00_09415 [Thermobacillus sp. ZCTH02-B1]